MYNDRNRQQPEDTRFVGSMKTPIGRSCPTFANGGGGSDIPRLDERIGNRLCDGTLPRNDSDNEMNGCGGENTGGWGLHSHPLAMVYSPLQEFHQLYAPEVALERGTLFAELDLPFEGGKGNKGGCCL